MSSLARMLPRPRRIRSSGRDLRFEDGLALRGEVGSEALEAAAGRLPFVTRGQAGGARAALSLELDRALVLDGARRPEGYRLEVGAGRVHIRGSDPAGVFRALQTLAQLAEPAPEGGVALPEVELDDWPDFPNRAVSLDVSRDKVPRMETLFELVDLLASWKINQLQLYMEHVFAYRGHEEVWRDASAITAEELRVLDGYCRDRFVELVPSQNCLAHFHRWLVHERYRPLAEVPEGILHPFSREPEPFSLCPTDPRSLELIADLFGQLLPSFSSKLVNVGLDEPIDLGAGRSRAACEREGQHRVFLDHLLGVRDLARGHGSTMQFWADWILNHPDAVGELPDDVIAMEWGYEADHPFEQHLDLLSSAVPRHYVCPGTSSWNSIGGRTSNALANLLRAGRVGRAAGSEGYMITDWGDHGHWQPLPVSYAGFLMGAAVAWNANGAPSPAELAEALDRLAFADEAGQLGRAALALGDAHLAARTKTVNGSAPFFLLHFAEEPLPHERLEGLSVPGLEACLASIEGAVSSLPAARPSRPKVVDELRWAADLMSAGCRLGIARLRADGAALSDLRRAEREPLARELRGLSEGRRALWLVRNRPGGLDDSVGRMERLADRLDPTPTTRPERHA